MIKSILNFCITIALLDIELDLNYSKAGWPWFGSIGIITINHRSMIYFDNWKTLDLFWFHICK